MNDKNQNNANAIMTSDQVRDSNPGHIGGKRTLPPLRNPINRNPSRAYALCSLVFACRKLSDSCALALILAVVLVSADCWGEWSDWSKCTKACGCGRQFKVRFCNCAHGQGHDQCQGFGESSQSCNCNPCPNGPPADDITEGTKMN